MPPIADELLPAQGAEVVRPPTVAQCHEVIDRLCQELAQTQQQMAAQQQQLADQQQQIAWLQERIKLDSTTSSKPPSSDGPASGSRAQRRASGRKRGAQKGHPGSFRALLSGDTVS